MLRTVVATTRAMVQRSIAAAAVRPRAQPSRSTATMTQMARQRETRRQRRMRRRQKTGNKGSDDDRQLRKVQTPRKMRTTLRAQRS